MEQRRDGINIDYIIVFSIGLLIGINVGVLMAGIAVASKLMDIEVAE